MMVGVVGVGFTLLLLLPLLLSANAPDPSSARRITRPRLQCTQQLCLALGTSSRDNWDPFEDLA